MEFTTILEIIGTFFSVIFLILVIKENIWCWLFGILGSAIAIYLFIYTKLYSEAILYTYYVVMGVYGWIKWSKKIDGEELPVTERPLKEHLFWILFCIAAAFSLGWAFANYSDANNPFADAFSTIFSFLATYFEAIKLLSAWIYWIVINGFSIWLYFTRGLDIYAGLMAFYFVLSFVGLLNWRKSYLKNKSKGLA